MGTGSTSRLVCLEHLIFARYRLHLWARVGSRYSDWLWVGRFGDQIPVGGRGRFFAPVQTSSGTHATCNTLGTGSFPGLKRPGRGFNHPPSPSASSSVLLWQVLW